MANKFQEVRPLTQQESQVRNSEFYTAPSMFEGIKAGVKQGFRSNIMSMARDKLLSEGAGLLDPELNRVLSAGEANALFEPSTPFDEDIRFIDATIRVERENYLRKQQAILEEADIGPLGQISSNFLGGIADPLSLIGAGLVAKGVGAIGSGILGSSRSVLSTGIAMKMGRVLQATARNSGFVENIGRELVENVAFSSAIEIPLAESLENVYGNEVSTGEHLFNIATGTAIGTLGRYIGGRVDRHFPSKNIDPDLSMGALKNAIDEALATGKAVDPEKVAHDLKYGMVQYATDPQTVETAYKIVGDFDVNTGHFYSTHKTDTGQGTIDSQVVFGNSYGRGLHMVSNPAMAVGKSLHLGEASVTKLDVTGLRLLDLDQSYGVDEPVMKSLRKILEGQLPEATVNRLMKSPSMKAIMDGISEIDTKSPNLKLHEHVNQGLARTQGFEGYIYREGFFDDVSAPNTDVGRGVFIFNPTEKVKSSVSDRLDLNTDQVRDFYNRMKHKEVETTHDNTKMIESNRKATKIWEQEYKNDNPLYSGEQWRAEYVETYSAKSQEKIALDSREVLTEAEETALSFSEMARQIETDETASSADKAFAANMMRLIEKSKKGIDTMDKAVKAAIVCGRRN